MTSLFAICMAWQRFAAAVLMLHAVLLVRAVYGPVHMLFHAQPMCWAHAIAAQHRVAHAGADLRRRLGPTACAWLAALCALLPDPPFLANPIGDHPGWLRRQPRTLWGRCLALHEDLVALAVLLARWACRSPADALLRGRSYSPARLASVEECLAAAVQDLLGPVQGLLEDLLVAADVVATIFSLRHGDWSRLAPVLVILFVEWLGFVLATRLMRVVHLWVTLVEADGSPLLIASGTL